MVGDGMNRSRNLTKVGLAMYYFWLLFNPVLAHFDKKISGNLEGEFRFYLQRSDKEV